MSGALSAVVVPLAAEHAEQVLAIYQAGIDEGNATFEGGSADAGARRTGRT